MTFTAKSAIDHLKFAKPTKDYILEVYNQPHRHYHNETHLDNMLRWVNPDLKNLDQLLQAIVFHDIIHCDKAVPEGYNEAASIAVLTATTVAAVGENLDIGTLLIPVEAINASAYHLNDQVGLGEISQIMLDLDLQSFSRPRDEFLHDSENVILEYMERGFTEAQVREGNEKFLRKLLQRKKLYYVVHEWEKLARANLEWRVENMQVKG